jgi:hypothetical protein
MAGKIPKVFQNLKGQRNPQSSGPSNGGNPNSGLTAATLNAMPILRSRGKESLLVEYIRQRMVMAQPERDARFARCASIDTQLCGFVKLDREDKMRFRDILLKGQAKPVTHNLALAAAQLDDAESYLMSVFAPDMNLFECAAPAEKSEAAKALTDEINRQGGRGMYYREFVKVCQGAMRYNFAAITCHWQQEKGYVFKAGQSGVVQKEIGTVWQGNAIHCADVYNFFYDTNIHPVDLPRKGEWFAEVDILSPFRAMKDQQDGREYGIDRFWNYVDNKLDPVQGTSFWRAPPIVRKDDILGSTGSETNWVSSFRGADQVAISSQPAIERWKWIGWVRPKMLGLSDSNNIELWAIHVMQGSYLTYAVRLDDTHGMLPVACAAPLEDDLGNNQRTYAERLLPLQHFSSFLLNTHQDATRKSLYGITVYDQRLFPGLDLSQADLTSAVIPMRGSAMNVDIDKAFRHYAGPPQTTQNVEMIDGIMKVMQTILPTDLYRQVADLERATLYQAAATVQTGNRRSLKIARMMSNQCLEVLKWMMVYNIYAKVSAVDYTDETGKTKQVPASQFVNLGLENYISNGLRGIDRLMIITAFKEVLSMVLQSQQAIQEIDIVKLLTYFFNLVGEYVDLNSFRKTPVQQATTALANDPSQIADLGAANGQPAPEGGAP